MKRFLYILITLLACMQMRAQERAERIEQPLQDMANRPTTNVLYGFYSGEWLSDSYLSPLTYDGWNAGAGSEWWKDSRYWADWRQMGSLQALGGKLIQSQKHNSITYFDIQSGWGMHHRWLYDTGKSRGIDGSSMEVYIGPYLDFDFMMKNISSNVNKPYSFDMGIDAELMAGISYRFFRKKTAYRVLYEGRINALGVMWMPDYGESYYEVTEKILKSSVSFAYPGNRQFVHQQLAMDFQLKKNIWRLGIRHEYLHYGDKNRHFARQSVSVVVGCIFDIHTTKTNISQTNITY